MSFTPEYILLLVVIFVVCFGITYKVVKKKNKK